MGRNTTTARPVKDVQLPVVEAVVEPEPETTPLPTEEDVKLLTKTVDAIIADLERAAEAEGNLSFDDDKMDGHVAANIKAFQDCIAKLKTAEKRHTWLGTWIQKRLAAADRATKAEARKAEAAAKAEKKAAEAAAKAAEAAAKAAPKKAAK